MRGIEHTKPYTVPDTCSDEALVTCYWHTVSREPRWLHGLRRDDGTPYLERRNRTQVFTRPLVISNSEQETRAS